MSEQEQPVLKCLFEPLTSVILVHGSLLFSHEIIIYQSPKRGAIGMGKSTGSFI